MPLVRVEVKNQYGLGKPELYREVNKEDPKAVLDGVAVAGLVGILRQLGDLAEFAGEVFHGLQEQVMATASRSHKLMVRVQHIEAAVPSLEKAVLAQKSHIHFAYTAGYEWHPRIGTEHNHFIYHDLPRFIMDSYEECRDPPRLHLLDKYDTGGPGSCLKRYSDPTFFRRATATTDKVNFEKVQRDRKAHKAKRKRSLQQRREVMWGSTSNLNSRMQFTTVNERTSSSQTASTVEMTNNSDTVDHSKTSFDSRAGLGYIESVFHQDFSVQTKEDEFRESSSRSMEYNYILDSVVSDEQSGVSDDKSPQFSLKEQNASSSLYVVRDTKAEAVDPENQWDDRCQASEMFVATDLDSYERGVTNLPNVGSVIPDEQSEVTQDNTPQVSPKEHASSLSYVIWDEKSEAVEPENQWDDRNIGSEIFITTDPDPHEWGVTNLPTLGSVIPDEESRVTGDKTPQFSQKEHYASSLSFVIRDAKAEAVEPENQWEDRNISLEMFVATDLDQHEWGVVANVREDDQMDVVSPYGSTLESTSNRNHIDEIDSEQDNYMDALNTIESESETEVDFKTKREVEQCSPVVNHEAADQMDELKNTQSSEQYLPELDSHTESHTSPDKGMISNLPNTLSSEIFSHEQVFEIAAKTSSSERSPGTFLAGSANNLHASVLESITCNNRSPSFQINGSQDPSGDKIVNSIHQPEGSSADSSSSHSVQFWTNGGLLGLQPSKPPDLAATMSNATNEDISNKSKHEKEARFPHTSMPNGNPYKAKMDDLTKNSGEKVSSNVLKQVLPAKELSHANGNGFKQTSMTASGAVFPVSPNNKTASVQANQEDEDSSRVFGLGHRFLINGFRSKLTLVHDEKSEQASSVNHDLLDEKSGNKYGIMPEISEKFLQETYVGSLPPSPPLEHMKISFHPVNAFETSKLQLTCPNGSQRFESTRDVFPSFQLVPEHAIPMHDFGSESDDTFCRSSPYMSDDCLSHQSESNSEQWEPGESPKSVDPELYDELRPILQRETIPKSVQFEETTNSGINLDDGLKDSRTNNDVKAFVSSDHLLDLPSFHTMNRALGKEIDQDDSVNLLALQSSTEPTPPQPPLPPAQWRVLKPHLDMAEDMKDDSEVQNLFHPKLLGSTILQQLNPTPTKEQETNEVITTQSMGKQQDQEKLEKEKEANRVRNVKGTDEREDFLQQIRTKSFNLRRTVTEKQPVTTAGLMASNKVTAIMEKANAIRQAVGDDDREDDDTWSDT